MSKCKGLKEGDCKNTSGCSFAKGKVKQYCREGRSEKITRFTKVMNNRNNVQSKRISNNSNCKGLDKNQCSSTEGCNYYDGKKKKYCGKSRKLKDYKRSNMVMKNDYSNYKVLNPTMNKSARVSRLNMSVQKMKMPNSHSQTSSLHNSPKMQSYHMPDIHIPTPHDDDSNDMSDNLNNMVSVSKHEQAKRNKMKNRQKYWKTTKNKNKNKK